MILVLKNIQYMHNITNHDLIDHATIMNAFGQEGVNLEEDLRVSILEQLPEVGHRSIFSVNTGGHWTAMMLYRTKDTIYARYNDSSGTPMPGILNQVLDSLGIKIQDYKCKVDGGHNSCGLKTIGQISEMIQNPDKNHLNPEPFHEHNHNALIRIFDVLFSSSTLGNVNAEEANIFLEMFYERHYTRDVEKLESNVKALYSHIADQQKFLERQQDLNKNKVDLELLITNDLLTACQQKMPQITDHKSDSYVDQMCKVLLEQLKVASQSSETTQISVHQEDFGGATVEKLEASDRKLIKDTHLKGLGMVAIFSDNSCELWEEDNVKHNGLLEDNGDGMTILHFPSANKILYEDQGSYTILDDVEISSQSSESTKTSTHYEDSGNAAEKHEISDRTLVKDTHLKGLGMVMLYDDNSCELRGEDNQIHQGSLNSYEEMTTLHFPSANVTIYEIDGSYEILGDVTSN